MVLKHAGSSLSFWRKETNAENLIGGYIPGTHGVNQLVVGEKRDDGEFNYIEAVTNGFVPTSRRRVFEPAVNNLFAGINIDLAVRDTDAWLYRLGYNITLLGKLVFVGVRLEKVGNAVAVDQPI